MKPVIVDLLPAEFEAMWKVSGLSPQGADKTTIYRSSSGRYSYSSEDYFQRDGKNCDDEAVIFHCVNPFVNELKQLVSELKSRGVAEVEIRKVLLREADKLDP
jgi:hypothetical protein